MSASPKAFVLKHRPGARIFTVRCRPAYGQGDAILEYEIRDGADRLMLENWRAGSARGAWSQAAAVLRKEGTQA